MLLRQILFGSAFAATLVTILTTALSSTKRLRVIGIALSLVCLLLTIHWLDRLLTM